MKIRVVIAETITYIRDYTLEDLEAITHTTNSTPETIIEFIRQHEPTEVEYDMKKNVRRPHVTSTWGAGQL